MEIINYEIIANVAIGTALWQLAYSVACAILETYFELSSGRDK